MIAWRTWQCRNCLRDWDEPYCDECGANLMPPPQRAHTEFLADLRHSNAESSHTDRGALLSAKEAR